MVTRTLSKSGFLVSFSARRHTNKFLRAESLISSSFNTRILRFALIFRAIALFLRRSETDNKCVCAILNIDIELEGVLTA